jgi:hypothetical protein
MEVTLWVMKPGVWSAVNGTVRTDAIRSAAVRTAAMVKMEEA